MEERLHISVIIPVKDRIDVLARCLASIKQSDFSEFEVIVVDDCSREDCSDLVKAHGFKAVRLDQPSGAWSARNKGAELAEGDIFVFTDCDMIVPSDALQRIYHQFSRNHYSAISGVCGLKTSSNTLVTRYKNLWMHYSYVNSPENFDWFISGIGAIKREAFFNLKGFDPTFYTKTGGGDLEFGRRLAESGKKIFLDKGLQTQHLQKYTFWGLLRNDYNRSKGWFKLVVEKKMVPYVIRTLRIANIYPAFIISVIVSLIFLFSLFLLPFSKIFLISTFLSLLVYFILNYSLFRFFQREGGIGFLLKVIPLSLLDHLVSGFGVIMGCISYSSQWLVRLMLKLIFRIKLRNTFHRLVNGRTYN